LREKEGLPHKDKKSATLEVSVLVLSSQYENSLFLIKIRAENKKNPQEFSECISIPVKVVSKVSQLQTKAKKRTRNRSTPTKDMFIQSMDKLDKGQEQHSMLLANLVEQSKQQTHILQFLIEDEFQRMHESMMSEEESHSPEHSSSKKRKLDTAMSDKQPLEMLHSEPSTEWDLDLNMAFNSLVESMNAPHQQSDCSPSFLEDINDIHHFSFEDDVISESPVHENISHFILPGAPTGILEASMDFGFVPSLFENNYYNHNL